jgi:hypothetical protein
MSKTHTKEENALKIFIASKKKFVVAHQAVHDAHNLFLQTVQFERSNLLAARDVNGRPRDHILDIANKNVNTTKSICIESISEANLLYEQAEQHAHEFVKIKSEKAKTQNTQFLKKRKYTHTKRS